MEQNVIIVKYLLGQYLLRGKLPKFISSLIILWGARGLVRRVMEWLHAQRLEKDRQGFRLECQRLFTKMEANILKAQLAREEVERITSMSLAELVDSLHTGYLKPSVVLAAYQTKALEAHKKTNCIIHPLEEAEEIARRMDEAADRSKPLFGVPISVKDDYTLKGYTCAMGLANLINHKYQKDCNIVRVLVDQGAIPFVKTNIPHFGFSLMTSNPISGQTRNPYDLSRTSGGSSGGEGALLACKGSIVGIGSDFGGSLRVPASYCGLYTLRPTVERMSHKGLPFSGEAEGQTRMCTSMGPMGRDVDSLTRIVRALWVPDLYREDMLCPPVPFRNEMYEKEDKMKVGYYFGDELFPVTPASKRAVLEAMEALKIQGHSVIEWAPPRARYGVNNHYLPTVSGDNGEGFKTFMYGDPPDPCLGDFFVGLAGPNTWWTQVKLLFTKYTDKHLWELKKHQIGNSSISDWLRTSAELEEWRREVESSFREAELDAVVCPAWPSCAPIIMERTFLQQIYLHYHTLFWNTMNVPVGVVPVTTVTEDDVKRMSDYKPDCAKWVEERVRHEIQTGVGLPLGVQVGAMRWEEETVLRAMREIERGLKNVP